jgi:hypothetical protein
VDVKKEKSVLAKKKVAQKNVNVGVIIKRKKNR